MLYLYTGLRGTTALPLPRDWYQDGSRAGRDFYANIAAYCIRRNLDYLFLASDDLAVHWTQTENMDVIERFAQMTGKPLLTDTNVQGTLSFSDGLRIDGEVFRTHALQRRQAAAEHVEAAGEEPRSVERPQVRDILHHTQGAGIAAGVGAYAARIGGVGIAADMADGEIIVDALQCFEQRAKRRFAAFEQVQNGAARRARPQTRQPGKRLNQRVDFGGSHCAPNKGLCSQSTSV